MRLPSLVVMFAALTASEAAAQEEDAAPAGVEARFEQGEGLVVESSDEQFGLTIRARGQIRAELTYPEEPEGAPGDLFIDEGRTDVTFMVRRARLVFSGYVFGPHNRFTLQLALAPRDMDWQPGVGPSFTPLRDYYLDFTHLRDLSVRVGQYKLPFSLERINSSGDLQLVDRSIVNDELSLDRDLGVDLRSKDFLGLGLLRYYAGIAAGEGRDAGFGGDLGFFYFARVEVFPLGLFDNDEQADLSRSAVPRLAVGGAYAFLDDAPALRAARRPRAQDGGTTDSHTATADVVFKWLGLSVFGSMIWREGWRNPGLAVDAMGEPLPITPPRNALGWLAQVGFLLPGVDLEVAARVAMIHPLGESAETSVEERGELGGGLSYYFLRHSLKLQLDYMHLWSGGVFDDAVEQVRLQVQAAL